MSKIKILEVVAGVLVLAGIVFYFNSGGFCGGKNLNLRVRGNSMTGIIEEGDRVKIRTGYYDCHDVKRGDVVAYKYAKEDLIIKRVVAVPGDTWSVSAATGEKGFFSIIVNGLEQETTLGKKYRINEGQAKMLSLYKSPVQKDAYMILGNLPEGTQDSTRFGLIGRRDIVGRAFY